MALFACLGEEEGRLSVGAVGKRQSPIGNRNRPPANDWLIPTPTNRQSAIASQAVSSFPEASSSQSGCLRITYCSKLTLRQDLLIWPLRLRHD